MAGRFLTQYDMHEARMMQAKCLRSAKEQGKKYVRELHWVCGCGVPGCIGYSLVEPRMSLVDSTKRAEVNF